MLFDKKDHKESNNLVFQRMNNSLIPQGVEVVTQAIEAYKNGDYENALKLYKR